MKWMDTLVWILMGSAASAALAMMVYALGFLSTLVILVVGGSLFLAAGLLWGCLELRNL